MSTLLILDAKAKLAIHNYYDNVLTYRFHLDSPDLVWHTVDRLFDPWRCRAGPETTSRLETP